MSNEDTQLEVIEPEESSFALDLIEEISNSDIKDINVSKITEHMTKSICILEIGMFNQASAEYKRVSKLRGVLETLEDDLFAAETLGTMDLQEKTELYKAVSRNLVHTQDFFHKLHSSVTSGLDAVTSIEKAKAKANVDSNLAKAIDESDKDNDVALLKMVKDALIKKTEEMRVQEGLTN